MRAWRWGKVLALAALGCNGGAVRAPDGRDAAAGRDAGPPDGGSDGGAGAPDAPDDGDAGSPPALTRRGVDEGCPDLFTQDRVRRYELEIDADVWAKIKRDFALGPPPGNVQNTYYPIRHLAYEGERRTDVRIRLKGDISWRYALKDPAPKAQFVIAFDGTGGVGPFHGVRKIDFDMYGYDRTMLNQRVATAFMRTAGLPAPCWNSAELFINGAPYGLFASGEVFDKRILNRWFPGRSGGALLKSGIEIEANEDAYDYNRHVTLWAARDLPAMRAVGVNLTDSLRAWAAEAIVNDADGYWAGDHNFYVYEEPGRGFRWITADLDSAFAWIPSMQHPLYWWAGRYWRPPVIPQHYLAVVGDPEGRAAFVAAIGEIFQRYDVAEIQGWIDAWSAQILEAVTRDPRRPYPLALHTDALAQMRAEVAERAVYLQAFLACASPTAPAGDDQDGDGARWCVDCDDTRADVHPNAIEICGDHVDQNCDSVADETCPQ